MDPIFASGHHTWAELLRLVKTIRWIAWHNMDDPAEQMRRIRDAFGEYDGLFDDDVHKRDCSLDVHEGSGHNEAQPDQ